jgi:hypothetical protein
MRVSVKAQGISREVREGFWLVKDAISQLCHQDHRTHYLVVTHGKERTEWHNRQAAVNIAEGAVIEAVQA